MAALAADSTTLIEKVPTDDESEAGQGASFDHHLVPPAIGETPKDNAIPTGH